MSQTVSLTTTTLQQPVRSRQRYKKILLIYPPFKLGTVKDNKEHYGSAVLPPLGMLTLAGELEKHHYEVSFIDAEAEQMDYDEVFNKAIAIKPDVVGIFTITANFDRLIQLSQRFKESFEPLIFFGGPHVWHNWQTTVNSRYVDFAVIGEGEETAVELLAKLNAGEPLKDIKGVAFKDGDALYFGGPRPFLKNLDSLAYSAFHLVDIHKYKPSPQHVRRTPSVTMLTSRGCPFTCTFCYVPFLFEKTFRLRSVDHVVGEIKSLVEKHGIKEIQFFDDLFGANRKWLREFLDKLIEQKIDISWSCITRIDVMDWELARKMKQAGCWCIFFGIESLDQDVLNAVNKRQTVEQIERAIKVCKDIGIEIRAGLILGSPTETPEKAKKIIKKLCKLNPDYVKFNVMTPYPDTKIYKEVKEEGKWGKLVENYNAQDLTNHEVVFVPFGYKNAEEVFKMRAYAYRKFYFRPRYILSRLTKIRSKYDILRHWRGLKLVLKRYAL